MGSRFTLAAERAAAAAVALVMCTATTGAQASAPGDTAAERARPSAERHQVLSIQPAVAIVGVFSLDYERAIEHGFTLGIGGSYWNNSTLGAGDLVRADYASAEIKGRFYPGGRPFRGLSVALTAGGSRVAYDDIFDVDTTRRRIVAHGFKVGTEVDYNWIVGRRQRLAFALGVGGKRIFHEDVAGSRKHLADSYPTSRIAMGYAF